MKNTLCLLGIILLGVMGCNSSDNPPPEPNPQPTMKSFFAPIAPPLSPRDEGGVINNPILIKYGCHQRTYLNHHNVATTCEHEQMVLSGQRCRHFRGWFCRNTKYADGYGSGTQRRP